jgi:DNA phosphorothioation-dependent restriction protein DptG
MAKWIKSEGYIIDTQTGEVICLIAKTEDKLRDKILEVAPELFVAALNYIKQMDNGKSAVRSTYNDFKEIFERIPEDLYEGVQV